VKSLAPINNNNNKQQEEHNKKIQGKSFWKLQKQWLELGNQVPNNNQDKRKSKEILAQHWCQ